MLIRITSKRPNYFETNTMARDTGDRVYLVCEHKTNGRALVPMALAYSMKKH